MVQQVRYSLARHGMVGFGKACPAADVAETKQEIGLNQDLTNQTCCFLFLPKFPQKIQNIFLNLTTSMITQYFSVVFPPCDMLIIPV